MSADLLRRAAKGMRERAEAATVRSPWIRQDYEDHTPCVGTPELLGAVADCGEEEDAEHIASWHPAVALAVADWLDAEAAVWTASSMQPEPGTVIERREWSSLDQAAAVARAYLGGTS